MTTRQAPPEMPAAPPRAARYDASALAVAQAVLQHTGAAEVILFGSRARGDHRPDSDIDLLLVHPARNDDAVRDKARCAAAAKSAAVYGQRTPVDFVWFTPQEFDWLRRSINSVAAIAAKEGIAMNGPPAGASPSNESDDYAAEWSVTGQRCYHARAHLRNLRLLIENREVMLMIGQQAHQAIEHAIKALISAAGRRYPRHHELLDLETVMRHADPAFTAPLESPLKALNDYGGRLRYDAPYAPLGDPHELRRQVESDVARIFQRIAALTGQDPWQEWGEDQQPGN